MTLLLLFQPNFSTANYVVRAPFYVPRPSDDPVWVTPLDSLPSGAITVTNTQVKFYGQPGQAPTKDWSPYWLDDPAIWEGSPEPSAVIPLLTQQVIYGKGGQVPTPVWNRDYTWDDPAVWTGTVLSLQASYTLTLLSHPLFFGQPGQAVPKDYSPFSYDDPAFCSVDLGPENSAIIPLLTQQTFYGRGGQAPTQFWGDNYVQDTSTVWSGSPESTSTSLIKSLAAVPTPFLPYFWPFQDDAAFWDACPENSAIIPLLSHQFIYGQGGQGATERWHVSYTVDDHAVWNWPPQHQWSISLSLFTQQKLYGIAGQGATQFWGDNYVWDDAAPWLAAPEASYEGLLQSSVIKLPPIQYSHPTFQDDASTWHWPPQLSHAIVLTTTQQKEYGKPGQPPTQFWLDNYVWDDAAFWIMKPLAGPVTAAPAVITELYGPANVRYDDPQDYASFWAGAPRGLSTVQIPPPPILLNGYMVRAPFYTPRPYDEPNWQITPIVDMTLRTPQTSPRIPQFWPFNNDDASPWYSQTRTSQSLRLTASQQRIYGLPGQVPTKQWRYDYDDAAFWAGTPLDSDSIVPLLTGVMPIARQWLFGDDANAVWAAAPNPLPNITRQLTSQTLFGPPGQTVAPFWMVNYTFDDPPGFKGDSTRPNTVTTFLTLPSNLEPQWPLFISSDEPWQLQPQRNTQTGSVAPSPFILRQPPFHADDASAWLGKPLIVPPGILGSVITFTPVAIARQWLFGQDDASPWAAPTNMLNISEPLVPLLTAAGIVRARQWTWGLDDASAWVGAPAGSLPLQTLLTASGLVVPRQWLGGLDDASAWSGAPDSSNLLAPLLTAAGQPPTKSWRYDNDDAAPWSGQGQKSIQNTLPPPPFTIRAELNYYSYDDHAVWPGGMRPRALSVIGNPVFQQEPVNLNIPDDQPWSLTFQPPTQHIPQYKNFFTFSGVWTMNIPHDTPSVMPPDGSAAIFTPQILPIRVVVPPSVGSNTAPKSNAANAPAEQRSGTAPKRDV